jgi:hypothetical protein
MSATANICMTRPTIVPNIFKPVVIGLAKKKTSPIF